jgi:hypothetical protein
MRKEKQGKMKIPASLRKILKSESFPEKLIKSVILMIK